MDFLDFLTIKDEEVYWGTYYSKRPKSYKNHGIGFSYDVVDPNDKNYAKLLENLRADKATLTIKTNDMCGFAIGGYIATQDGEFWQINGISKRDNPENKQALRNLTFTVNTEFVIRLINVENPMELK